ncbi:MAG TPA: PAS domain S-box protein [Syntrophorhabdales bacterium]|nr:PAS domain S-box protein [Syntrophorhabdales bacterium]
MRESQKSTEESTIKKTEEKKKGRDGVPASSLVDSMTLINRSYVYEFASEAYCRSHGKSRKEIIGSSVASIWGEEDFNKFVKRYLEQCFAGNVVHYENWLEFPGVGLRCYRVTYSPYFNERGQVTHAVVASHDITDAKKEQEALEKSETQFRTILKSMHYGVYTFDTEGRFTYVNDVVAKRSGYPREWHLEKTLFDLVRTEERDMVRKNFEAAVRGEHVPPYEFAYYKPDGEIVWVHISTTAIREGGRVVGVLGLLLDVTKRRKSEEALKESEEKYRTLFENSRDAIFITDREGRHIDVNRSFLDLFGHTKEEIRELNAVDIYLSPEDLKTYVNAIEQNGFAKDFDVKLKRKDGTVMDCLVTGTTQRHPDGTIIGYQGIVRDETVKKRVEAALKDSEQKLKSILYSSPIPQFVIDKNHRVTHWNRALEVLSGIKAQHVIGTNQHWKAFYNSERPCIADLLVDEALGQMTDWYGGKFSRSQFIDGAYKATDFFQEMGSNGKWLYFTAAVIRDSRNNIVGALETLEDITHQKIAEQALRSAEAKYRSIFENAVEGIFQTTPEGQYMNVNPAYARILGYDSTGAMMEEVTDIGKQLYVKPEDRLTYKAILAEEGIIQRFETQFYRKDGSICWVSINARAVKDQSGRVLYYEGTMEDFTKSKLEIEELKKMLDERKKS